MNRPRLVVMSFVPIAILVLLVAGVWIHYDHLLHTSQMATMTATFTPSSDGTGQQDLNLYANGKKVAVVADQEPGDYRGGTEGAVNFYAGNSQKVLFNVMPELGFGGGSDHNGAVNMLDLKSGAVTLLAWPATPEIDWTPDLVYIAYTSLNHSNNIYALHVLNTDTKADEAIDLPGVPPSLRGQFPYVGEIKISPDQTKVAVVQDYSLSNQSAPDAGTIYLVNLLDKTIVVYQQDDSRPLQIKGWKNNTDINWSPY